MSLPAGQVIATTWGPIRRARVFIDLAEGEAPVREPAAKGSCWALATPRDSRPYACSNFARSTGTGAYCTCHMHRKHEAAARKLKAELGSNK